VEANVLNGTNLLRAERMQHIGGEVLRWSLVFLLGFFGALKWTQAEALAIVPFIANSPLLSWTGYVLGPQHASEMIGIVELVTALLIALRRWNPLVTLAGGLLGALTFLTTLSFLVTTPHVGDGAPFLLKDLTLLGAAVWIAGEAWVAVERGRQNSEAL
jgi:reactive chlorine resistance protein C